MLSRAAWLPDRPASPKVPVPAKARTRAATKRVGIAAQIERLERRTLLAYTAALAGGAVTFTGDAAADILVFDVESSGNLRHNRFTAGDAGFASDNDLDSATAGEQSLMIGSVSGLTTKGGDGNDTINASALGNEVTLDGGGGNDSLIGGSSDDSLTGGLGNDTLTGGAGNDTADFSDAPNGVKVNLSTGSARGVGTDRLPEIENVIGSAFDDMLTGKDSANHLMGRAGIDRIKGQGGDDTLDGGAGNDIIHGGIGRDILLGGADNDQLIGHFGRDLLIGGIGGERLVGTDDDDLLIAGSTDNDSNDAALRAIIRAATRCRTHSPRLTRGSLSFAQSANSSI